MLTYAAGTPGAPRLLLAHGAGAGMSHPWMTRIARGLAARGVTVVTFDFPYVAAGRRRPDTAPVLEEAFQVAWAEMTRGKASGSKWFAGGKSMGGRIASQVAARDGFRPAAAGLVFFGYPLHPPAAPARRRDRHLPAVAAPLLFVHGSRDPFGNPDEMRTLAESLPSATLHVIEGGDHSLQLSKGHDREGRALDRAMDVAAEWILRLTGTREAGS
jgi:predicted alpha/beta-hydrolase family hydrolase